LCIFVREAVKIDKMSNREIVGLFELQSKLKGVVESSLPARIWLRAETGEVKLHSAGHCYLDLIEKADNGGVRAKVQAIVWASTFRMLRPFFETTTGRPLERGLKILVNVTVQYSQLYGLSLVVNDIDPSFTIGDQEAKRQQTIARLKKEGMMEMNGQLEIPLLPRRIAVVSSENAAGYRDFMMHLHQNEFGFLFESVLFPAPMQGDTAPAGIINALEKIAEHLDSYDLVMILRGGGAAQDLVCFDHYELCVNIAQFPLPVVTGIGHDHDYHIADMVAHTSVKTPTAAADFMLDVFAAEEQQVAFLSRKLFIALQGRIESENGKLDKHWLRIANALKNRASQEEHRIELLESRLVSANPASSLEKGFAIVYKGNGRLLSAKEAKVGDSLSVLLKDGRLECEIVKKVKNLI
jgi:exodeoxyribonuclease VII large subunit